MKKTDAVEITWAVDSRPEVKPLQIKMAKFMSCLEKSHPLKVSAVHVDAYGEIGENSDTSLQNLVAECGLTNVQTLALKAEDSSLQTAVRILERQARENKASFIVCGTAGLKGTSPFPLGSFTETLLQNGASPLFLVTPSTIIPERIELIHLCEADLTHKFFAEHIAILADTFGAEIRHSKSSRDLKSIDTVNSVLAISATLGQGRAPTLSGLTREMISQAKIPVWIAPINMPHSSLSKDDLRRIAAGERG